MSENDNHDRIEIEGNSIELGECPNCRRANIIDKGPVYGCENYPVCKFTIHKEILGKKISVTIVKQLVNHAVTPKRLEFMKEDSNSGEVVAFDAHLCLEKIDGVLTVRTKKYIPLGKCPRCKKGNFTERDKVYKCDNKDCGAYCFKNFWEVPLSPGHIQKMLGDPGHVTVSKLTKDKKNTRRVKLEMKDLIK